MSVDIWFAVEAIKFYLLFINGQQMSDLLTSFSFSLNELMKAFDATSCKIKKLIMNLLSHFKREKNISRLI